MADDLIFGIIKAFIRSRETHLCKPTMMEWYKNRFKPFVGKDHLHEVDVEQYMKDMLVEGLAPSTMQSRIRALRIILKWMHKTSFLEVELDIPLP